jgi:DNA-binding LacI/PurR family transcriptional regulator
MGRTAAQMLGELIDGSSLRLPRIELSTELIVRESAAAPVPAV